MGGKIVKVSDVMRTTIHMVSGLASVHDAIKEMSRLEVSSLVIERRDEHDEFGVITVHDIASKVVAVNKATERTSIYEVMTKPALTLDSEMNAKYAIRLLSRFGLTRALVIHGKELLGIVTLRDLVLGYVDAADPEADAAE
ncbi:MAG: CBS domain-containing protein [Alphaproteobacteria bacterium]|nr:CBS domain-containing protein [Alphaproteobacteria bacterium]